MALKLRPGVFDAETEYGIVLLDGESGEYFDLNPTGALVLRTMLAGGTAGQAAQALTKEFSVGIDDATRDVQELLADLRSARLVDE
ncbi:MAG TPA: lasso peptide biosynthesis PqqD family chaperone [Actinophytocola sp.]|uniref:lasso peptide biosynthesis PqqD family chaperone n=1 Tax=Actinophytocola sp. TaxID=1872138 RepID=UPI002DDCD4AF|nr:lasso peptide biosynthesis PqqD family chaperone [Actinophytocola sp.]HEV2784069.1 lasso peptide biosynthesis PqqD family chaperone [Actinophytocola sp.]